MRLNWLQVYEGEIYIVQRLHRIAHGVAYPVGVVKGDAAIYLNVELGPHLRPDIVGDHPVHTGHTSHLAGGRIDLLQ